MVEAVELIFYMDNGEEVIVSLSDVQTETIFKILMISPNDTTDSLNVASDRTLLKLWQMKGNPLHLKAKD